MRKRLVLGRLLDFTSYGLSLYFYALSAHFESLVGAAGHKRLQWQMAAGLIYGQRKKAYRRRRLVRMSYQMLLGRWEQLKGLLQGLGLSGELNTAFVERVNLTIRQSVVGLVRNTWSTAQKTPCLLAHLEWWRVYYHFVRTHESLRVKLAVSIERRGKRPPQPYRQLTPAVEVGLTNRRWTVREILALPMVPGAMIAA